jgi:hypothetical protein
MIRPMCGLGDNPKAQPAAWTGGAGAKPPKLFPPGETVHPWKAENVPDEPLLGSETSLSWGL